MKLKHIGEYIYSDSKKFKLYEDDYGNQYLEKSAPLQNYTLLRQISEIAENTDHLHGISGFYKKDQETVNYLIPLLTGTTLEKLILEKTTIDVNKIKQIIYQLALGLKELHENNILHRDIKPANIIIDENDCVMIIDYDISREYKEDANIDTTASGTRGFAAPEQYGFMQTDIRSDIYSLGKTIENLVNNCCSEHYYNFKEIVDNCCAIDPSQRYETVDEIIVIVSKDYPTFFDEQLKQIKKGLKLGLTHEQVAIYANAKFNANQMGVIKHALDEDINQEIINLMADEHFTSRQMWQIKRGALDGLKLNEIKRYAKPYYTPDEMSIYRTGLKHKKNSKEINDMQKYYVHILVNYTFSKEQLTNIRYLIYTNFTINDIIKFIEKEYHA